MVLLSWSDTGAGIYAKLAKRNASIQWRSGFSYPQFSGVAIFYVPSTGAVCDSRGCYYSLGL